MGEHKGDSTGRKRKMPDLALEQKALDELPPGMEGELERLWAEDETVAERLAGIEQSNREILEQYPPGPMVAQIQRRAAGENHRPRRWSLWVGLPTLAAGAAAALVLLVAVPALRQPGSGPLGVFAKAPPEIIIVKGGSRLKIYRKGESKMLMPGAKVAEGDDLMVHYDASNDARYGVILSLDGRGRVSLHFPLAEDDSTELVHGGDQALAHSFELDDAPRFERFFFLTSAKPIDVKAMRTAIEALGKRGARANPHLPGGIVVKHEMLLWKRQAAQVIP